MHTPHAQSECVCVCVCVCERDTVGVGDDSLQFWGHWHPASVSMEQFQILFSRRIEEYNKV